MLWTILKIRFSRANIVNIVTTSTKQTLNQHIQFIQNGVKHNCEYCVYKASQKSNLQRHVQFVHERVKHSCEYCYYKATTKSDLRMHMQSIHDAVKHSFEYWIIWMLDLDLIGTNCL